MANKTSKSSEAYFARYKTERKWESNRKKKLQRALNRNPGNAEQINKALDALVYRRKTPKTTNPVKQKDTLLAKKFTSGPVYNVNTKPKMGFFSISARMGLVHN